MLRRWMPSEDVAVRLADALEAADLVAGPAGAGVQ